MHTTFNNSLRLACALGLSAVAACGQESTPPQQPVSLALERPLEVCQDQYDTCRLSPSFDPAACQDSMRKCLTSVATWMQESRALIEKCRELAVQCRIQQPTEVLSCNDQFDSCVAPAFQPSSSDEDAGVSDDDAGVSTAPSTPTGAAGSVSAPPVPPPPTGGTGGSPAPGEPPGLPPTLPGSLSPADACRSQLLECLTPAADLVSCATHARECLRADLLPIP